MFLERKKVPPLRNKEPNPEFFQRLETRVFGEVEVVVPRRFLKSSTTQNEEDPDITDYNSWSKSKETYQPDETVNLERRAGDPSPRRREFDNKGNLLGIQRQLLQLETQQAYTMNMLQDFKSGSRDGMVTVEHKVWSLERVVQDMARNLSVSNYSQRGSNYGFSEYRYMGTNMRGIMGRGSSWDYKHGQTRIRRAMEGSLPKGVGPSARSVWQATKDEATLEAIKVAAPQMKADENVLTAWRNAINGVCEGDMDVAFGEVLATGDDLLLVKLMDRTGPVVDQMFSYGSCIV